MMQNGDGLNVTEPGFRKNSSPTENAGNMPENRFFGIFSKFIISFFLIFCTKMRTSNAKNRWPIPIISPRSLMSTTVDAL